MIPLLRGTPMIIISTPVICGVVTIGSPVGSAGCSYSTYSMMSSAYSYFSTVKYYVSSFSSSTSSFIMAGVVYLVLVSWLSTWKSPYSEYKL